MRHIYGKSQGIYGGPASQRHKRTNRPERKSCLCELKRKMSKKILWEKRRDSNEVGKITEWQKYFANFGGKTVKYDIYVYKIVSFVPFLQFGVFFYHFLPKKNNFKV